MDNLMEEVKCLKNVLRGDEEQLKRVVDQNAVLRDALVTQHQAAELREQSLRSDWERDVKVWEERYDALRARLAVLEKVAEAAREYMASFDSPMVLVHDEMLLLENIRAALAAAKEGK